MATRSCCSLDNMKLAQIRTTYYRQGDADHSLEVPAEAFTGWEQARVEMDLDRTAVVVMHAYTIKHPADFPNIARTNEYSERADRIAADVFPPLLSAVRAAGIRLFHVVGAGNYYQHLPGFKHAAAIEKREPAPPVCAPDPTYLKLFQFHSVNTQPGFADADEHRRYCAALDFYPEARPVGDEGIARTSDQLFALCQEAGVNHLIYAGFCINWCLLLYGGGMADMYVRRRGMICSTFRQAVTAVENKETARHELMKEEALWRVATHFGFVFDVPDFIADIRPQSGNA
jgi:hypothetical protein